jgi:hypothetical protein
MALKPWSMAGPNLTAIATPAMLSMNFVARLVHGDQARFSAAV